MELDEAAGVLSYEAYHPYGSTAFHSAKAGAEVSAKRYRYTGKERDEETGLYYHGARYYAPRLGRWTAADPAGRVDGLNLYRYSRDNPINFVDPSGTEGFRFDLEHGGASGPMIGPPEWHPPFVADDGGAPPATPAPTAREEGLQESQPATERELPAESSEAVPTVKEEAAGIRIFEMYSSDRSIGWPLMLGAADLS